LIGMRPGTKVFLACKPIDLRNGFDGLRISLIVGARFARWWAPISRDRGQFGA